MCIRDRISPWEPHAFTPGDGVSGGVYLVLYIDQAWFQRMARTGHSALHFGRSGIEVTPRIGGMLNEVVSLLEDYDPSENFDGVLFELTDACFAQSWQIGGGWQRYNGPAASFIDFRVRKSIVLMSEQLGSDIELDAVARDAGARIEVLRLADHRHAGLGAADIEGQMPFAVRMRRHRAVEFVQRRPAKTAVVHGQCPAHVALPQFCFSLSFREACALGKGSRGVGIAQIL